MTGQTFTCYKCTRTGQIFASDAAGCWRIAHAIGWRTATSRPGVICSRCPGGNAKGNLTLAQAVDLECKYLAAIQDPVFRAELEAADGPAEY